MNKNIKKLELTAPAGGMNQLIAAVNAGADSIYLGYRKFGARAYADNFDLNQLKKAVIFAHGYNIKIYLTLNTLIKDNQIKEVIDFLRQYTAICTDGIIIQDFCVYKIIKDLFKPVPVHASTQLNLHNLYSLKLIKGLGFKRAILTREMTLSEIEKLCKESLVEIEIFAHGSQCYSYSGSCYFSSFIGGRSGNRGKCTQPCRMKYKLLEIINGKNSYISTGEGYILSKSDLYLLNFIPQIAEAGVDALKIEGRMKSAEYVGMVTKIYRKYIDLYYSNPLNYRVDEYDQYKLTQIFSRELGSGYINDEYPSNIISLKKSGSIGNFLGRVYRIDYENKDSRKIEYIHIRSRWEINNGDIIEIWTKKGNSRITVKDFKILDKQDKEYRYRIKVNRIQHILEKDRVFKFFDKKINEEASALFKYNSSKNNFKASSVISGVKIHPHVPEGSKIEDYLSKYLVCREKTDVKKFRNKLGLIARVYNFEFIESLVNYGVKGVIYSNFKELVSSRGFESDMVKSLKACNENKNIILCMDTPQIIYDRDFMSVKNNLSRLLNEGIVNFRVSNPGMLEFLLEMNKSSRSDINIYLSSHFNLFNTPAVVFFNEFTGKRGSLKGAELSAELNLNEVSKIVSNIENLYRNKPALSIMGHGYVQIMNSRYKLEFITGKKEGGKFYIEDIKGYRFPVDSDYNHNIMIFNSKNICTLFDLEKIKESGISSIIIDSCFYNEKDFFKILKNYREAINILYDKGIEKYKNFVSYLKNDKLFSNYSRGHLFRGVE